MKQLQHNGRSKIIGMTYRSTFEEASVDDNESLFKILNRDSRSFLILFSMHFRYLLNEEKTLLKDSTCSAFPLTLVENVFTFGPRGQAEHYADFAAENAARVKARPCFHFVPLSS